MTFDFRGQTFEYFRHPYNNVNHNMRTVEIPIALWYIGQAAGRILEIGCVLPHYAAVSWPVIDLREKCKGAKVANVDIMKFWPKRPYDLIVSVSTLEHVGYNKYTHEALYPFSSVVERVRKMLAPGGVFVATVPIGWRLDLDAAIRDGKTGAAQLWFMRQTSEQDNAWAECTLDEALAQKRGRWMRAMTILQCGQASPERQPEGFPRERQ